MPTVKKSILISASPAEVFSIISDIENMSSLSDSIEKITRVNDNNYHWKVNLAGMTLEWNAELLKIEEPKYLSWHSIDGIENRGEYVLEPQDGMTRLTFFMEYHLPSKFVELMLHALLDESMQVWLTEILSNLKKEIEKIRR